MKRILSIFLAIVLVCLVPLVSSASAMNGNTINLGSYTIEFSESSTFSTEKQQEIALILSSGKTDESTSTTYNVLCTLFGHKTTTESITVIEHCVRDTPPRCLKSLQDVTACSRCDYVTVDVFSSVHIYCCD